MAQDTHYSNDKVHDMREKAGEQLGNVAGQVESAVKSMAERGREAGESR